TEAYAAGASPAYCFITPAPACARVVRLRMPFAALGVRPHGRPAATGPPVAIDTAFRLGTGPGVIVGAGRMGREVPGTGRNRSRPTYRATVLLRRCAPRGRRR